jgi:ankyrin repeat protein
VPTRDHDDRRAVDLKAIWAEDVAAVERLLRDGADVHAAGATGRTPLMQAAEAENLRIIDRLLEAGADVNATGDAGQTALHCAVDMAIDGAIQNDREVSAQSIVTIERLLRAGADVHARDDRGQSPADWARRDSLVLAFIQRARP